MQRPDGPSGESRGAKGKDRRPEPLPLLVSAALEPGTPTLAARLERIAAHGAKRARYTVLGELAQGGMGKILRAWDEGLSREVAMKVVSLQPAKGSSDEEHADHEKRLARFIDEARITGQLDHPGIVPVYEIGLAEGDADASGAVFFTMPLLRGADLKSVFERVHRGADGWTLQRAVDVMHTVCMTVAFAHQKGVVHRDLKPENIMVGPFGEAYVLDWGLALLLGRAERGSIVGTPAYMSPEQAAGRSAEVGPRSDVYSLGAILYELFARRVPHELSLETHTDASEPFESVLAAPPRPLSELNAVVPPELAAICAKAMVRDPGARYASALEMAADLEAWLAGRVVSVLGSGPWTRLRKWRARNRGLAFALEGIAALCLVGGAAFLLQERTWLKEVEAKHALARVSAYAAGLSAADLGLRAHEVGESKRRLAACEPLLRGWEWRHLALRADASERVLRGHQGAVRSVTVSPDGRTLASASDDGDVVLWDADGTLRARLEGHTGFVTRVVFAPDGTRLASASIDKSVLLWDVRSGQLERLVTTHPANVVALAFSHDGRVLASGDSKGMLVLTSIADGGHLAYMQPAAPDGLVALDFVPGTDELAAAYHSGFVRVFGPALELRRQVRASQGSLTGLDADPEGCFLAVACEGSAVLLDATTLARVSEFGAPGSKISALAFAPDGSHLATCGYDSVLRVWDLARRRVVSELDGHDNDVNAVAFFPDGRRIVTGAEDDSLRVWDLERAPVLVLAEHDAWIDALAFAPDGRTLLTGARDGVLRLVDAGTGAELSASATPGIVDCVAWGADGEVFYGCSDPAPRRAPAFELGLSSALPSGAGYPKTLVNEPSTGRLFARDSKGTVRVYDTENALELATVPTDDETASLALSRDGRWLAAGTKSGAVLLWDARSYLPLASLPGEGAVTALAFSPDGTRLAVGRQTRTIALFATGGGALVRTLEGHESLVSCLAFSPDGARLVSGSYDHTLRVWDPENDGALLTLHGHTQAVMAVAFDPAGEVVASASKDETLRLWRTAQAFASVPAPANRSNPQ